jgi:hypothetical protein
MATASDFPEPPPISVAGLFFPANSAIPREIKKAVWQALKMYCETISFRGAPWPGWEGFERELAFQFATLLSFLGASPRESARRKLLDLFLASLNLENKRGAARKAKKDLMDLHHGEQMNKIWNDEVRPAWKMKKSLEAARAMVESRLTKSFKEDVVLGVLSRKATAESSLSRVYAKRKNLSFGRARNALREYQRQTGTNFATQPL